MGIFPTTIGLVFVLSTPAVRAAPIDPPAAQGVPVSGGGGITETTSEIMARHERMSLAAPQKTLDFFIGRADTSHKKADPDAANRLQGPAVGPQSPQISNGGGPLLPQTIGVEAEGPGSGATPCATPPDTMGAVGPTQFISFVNCNIVSYNKATGVADGVLNTTPNNFFNSVRNSSGTSDTHIRYDRTSQRWFLVIINVAFPKNRVLLAVSNSETITPSTVWSFFFFSSGIGTHTNCLADYPVPGVDANAVTIGVNQFCGASLTSANYAGSDIFVVQKSSVLGGGPIKVTGFPSSGFFTYPWSPHGVDNSDPLATESYRDRSQQLLVERGGPDPRRQPRQHVADALLSRRDRDGEPGKSDSPAAPRKHRRDDRRDRRHRQPAPRRDVPRREPLDRDGRRCHGQRQRVHRGRGRERGPGRRLLVGDSGNPDRLDPVDPGGGRRLRPCGVESHLLQLRDDRPERTGARRGWLHDCGKQHPHRRWDGRAALGGRARHAPVDQRLQPGRRRVQPGVGRRLEPRRTAGGATSPSRASTPATT